jgi:hypothetical protein
MINKAPSAPRGPTAAQGSALVLAVFEAASCATTPLPRVVVIGTLVVATLLPRLLP